MRECWFFSCTCRLFGNEQSFFCILSIIVFKRKLVLRTLAAQFKIFNLCVESKLKKQMPMETTTNYSNLKKFTNFLAASLFHVFCAIGASGAAGALWAWDFKDFLALLSVLNEMLLKSPLTIEKLKRKILQILWSIKPNPRKGFTNWRTSFQKWMKN